MGIQPGRACRLESAVRGLPLPRAEQSAMGLALARAAFALVKAAFPLAGDPFALPEATLKLPGDWFVLPGAAFALGGEPFRPGGNSVQPTARLDWTAARGVCPSESGFRPFPGQAGGGAA